MQKKEVSKIKKEEEVKSDCYGTVHELLEVGGETRGGAWGDPNMCVDTQTITSRYAIDTQTHTYSLSFSFSLPFSSTYTCRSTALSNAEEFFSGLNRLAIGPELLAAFFFLFFVFLITMKTKITVRVMILKLIFFDHHRWSANLLQKAGIASHALLSTLYRDFFI